MYLLSEWSNPAGIRIYPRIYACPGYQQVSWRSDQNERASLETPFSHYKSTGNFSDAQGHLTL